MITITSLLGDPALPSCSTESCFFFFRLAGIIGQFKLRAYLNRQIFAGPLHPALSSEQEGSPVQAESRATLSCSSRVLLPHPTVELRPLDEGSSGRQQGTEAEFSVCKLCVFIYKT